MIISKTDPIFQILLILFQFSKDFASNMNIFSILLACFGPAKTNNLNKDFLIINNIL